MNPAPKWEISQNSMCICANKYYNVKVQAKKGEKILSN